MLQPHKEVTKQTIHIQIEYVLQQDSESVVSQ